MTKDQINAQIEELNTLVEKCNTAIEELQADKFDESIPNNFEMWSDILNLYWDTDGSVRAKKDIDTTFSELTKKIKTVNNKLDSLKKIGTATQF